MRVIAGEKRGTRLLAPEGLDTRPTADRVKEALFGSLQFELTGKTVLDLFAGSGALGLEALSRGASYAVFADSDRKAIELIKSNIERTGYAHKTKVYQGFFDTVIKLFPKTIIFDIVLLDPPYAKGYYKEAVELLMDAEVLAHNALIVAEGENEIKIDMPGITTKKLKKYGHTMLTYFRYKGANE